MKRLTSFVGLAALAILALTALQYAHSNAQEPKDEPTKADLTWVQPLNLNSGSIYSFVVKSRHQPPRITLRSSKNGQSVFRRGTSVGERGGPFFSIVDSFIPSVDEERFQMIIDSPKSGKVLEDFNLSIDVEITR